MNVLFQWSSSIAFFPFFRTQRRYVYFPNWIWYLTIDGWSWPMVPNYRSCWAQVRWSLKSWRNLAESLGFQINKDPGICGWFLFLIVRWATASFLFPNCKTWKIANWYRIYIDSHIELHALCSTLLETGVCLLVGGFKHFLFIFHNVWDNPSHWLI